MQIRNLPARVAQLLKRRCSSMNVITTSSQRHHTPYSEESEWLVLFGASISANVYKNLREYK